MRWAVHVSTWQVKQLLHFKWAGFKRETLHICRVLFWNSNISHFTFSFTTPGFFFCLFYFSKYSEQQAKGNSRQPHGDEEWMITVLFLFLAFQWGSRTNDTFWPQCLALKVSPCIVCKVSWNAEERCQSEFVVVVVVVVSGDFAPEFITAPPERTTDPITQQAICFALQFWRLWQHLLCVRCTLEYSTSSYYSICTDNFTFALMRSLHMQPYSNSDDVCRWCLFMWMRRDAKKKHFPKRQHKGEREEGQEGGRCIQEEG